MGIGLAQRLREGTQVLHRQAERAGIMPALLRGELPMAGFARLQHSLLAIYQALEAGLRQHAAHPPLAPLLAPPLWPALARCDALHADLLALRGPALADTMPMVPAASAYARRLQQLAAEQPTLLAAHAYVRYLGDLAGGQALRRVAQRSYRLTGAAGTHFFDFGPPARVAQLSQALRQALDALPLDDAGSLAMVAEAQWAFAQHVRLFDDLAHG